MNSSVLEGWTFQINHAIKSTVKWPCCSYSQIFGQYLSSPSQHQLFPDLLSSVCFLSNYFCICQNANIVCSKNTTLQTEDKENVGLYNTHVTLNMRLLRRLSPVRSVNSIVTDKATGCWSIPSGPDLHLYELIGALAKTLAIWAHNASTRERQARLPVPCLRSSHQRQQIAVSSQSRRAQQIEGRKKTCTTPPTKPQALLFLTRVSASTSAPPPTLQSQPKAMHPGCAWQLATSPATTVFPLHPLPWPYQQLKNLPACIPLTECASHFFERVNNFCVCVCLPLPLRKRGGKGPCHSSTT